MGERGREETQAGIQEKGLGLFLRQVSARTDTSASTIDRETSVTVSKLTVIYSARALVELPHLGARPARRLEPQALNGHALFLRRCNRFVESFRVTLRFLQNPSFGLPRPSNLFGVHLLATWFS